jgi:integrase
LPTGRKSYAVVALDPRGKQIWVTLGDASVLGIADARTKARSAIAAIKSGQDRAGPQGFQSVVDGWLKRHVDAKGLRSAAAIRRYFALHILPKWAGRDFTSIKRVDVARLLDDVEDLAGPVAADKVMAYLSSLFNWYAARHDGYVTPLVKGMRRSNPNERARERVLTDGEIKEVWAQAEVGGPFGGLLLIALLTAQRRAKIAAMKWEDVSEGVWTIATAPREKGNGGSLILPKAARAVIERQPRFASNPHVFAGRGRGSLGGWSKLKKSFDKRLTNVMPWQIHDLRRTARSLMARAGVAENVAERVMGHAIPGVKGVYDRHSYAAEKATALEALAELLTKITSPLPRKR